MRGSRLKLLRVHERLRRKGRGCLNGQSNLNRRVGEPRVGAARSAGTARARRTLPASSGPSLGLLPRHIGFVYPSPPTQAGNTEMGLSFRNDTPDGVFLAVLM